MLPNDIINRLIIAHGHAITLDLNPYADPYIQTIDNHLLSKIGDILTWMQEKERNIDYI